MSAQSVVDYFNSEYAVLLHEILCQHLWAHYWDELCAYKV
jgi:hypothetical protein